MRSAGFEQRIALVRDDDLRSLAPLHMIFNLFGEVVNVDDGFADAGICEPV